MDTSFKVWLTQISNSCSKLFCCYRIMGSIDSSIFYFHALLFHILYFSFGWRMDFVCHYPWRVSGITWCAFVTSKIIDRSWFSYWTDLNLSANLDCYGKHRPYPKIYRFPSSDSHRNERHNRAIDGSKSYIFCKSILGEIKIFGCFALPSSRVLYMNLLRD